MTAIYHSLSSSKDGKFTIYFHPGQLRIWNSTARIIGGIAGSQGGKTVIGPPWLWREIMRRGSGDYIAATASYDLFHLKMLPAMKEYFETILGIGKYWKGDRVMEICNPETGEFAKYADDAMWARIILRSASSEGGLESTTAKAAWLDEAGQDEFALDAWDAVQRRLTIYQGRTLITTTPYNLGWLKQQIIDKDGQDGIEVINFASVDNPSFPKEEDERLRRTLPTWKYMMFHKGLLTRPPGMIFGDFIDRYRDEGGHLVRPFDVPQQWPRYQGVDPGAVNTAKGWWAHDTDKDIFYLYRESLEGGKSTAEHAKGSVEIEAEKNERVIMRYVGQKAEVQVRLDWDAAGVSNVSEPPFHDVEAGIDKLIGLFKEFRLYIFDTCTGSRDQFGRYARKLDPLGNTTDEIKDKQTFHYIDMNRYLAAGVTYPVADWEPVLA